MQTKSPLARIAGTVGLASAILALCIFAKAQHSVPPSRGITTKQPAAAAGLAAQTSASRKHDWMNAYGDLPLAFEANQGQADSAVRFLSRGEGYELFLTEQEAVFTLRQAKRANTSSLSPAAGLKARRGRPQAEKVSVLRMGLAGANPAPAIDGVDRMPGNVNYLIGNDPHKWHTDVPTYAQVKYQGLYPGVDLVFYGNQRHLEYDFVVAPGANPKSIALNIEGAQKLGINSRGDLLMSVRGGRVVLQKPLMYQEVNGTRREVAGSYAIASDHRIGFAVSGYDRTQPLTIDPVLTYSTYLGGSGTFGDFASGIALDAAGDAYVAGTTYSDDFPQQSGLGITPTDIAALGTAFVSELNPTGTALIYSTFLGGSGNGALGDSATAIAVDTSSPPNIYVTGFTGSPDFPVSTSPAPLIGTPGPAGTSTHGSAFVTKLMPGNSGTAQLEYSSYLGGNTHDAGFGIAVDTNHDAYVVGVTLSTNFPTTPNAISTSLLNSHGSAFLSEISTTAASGPASLVYSTYFGGTNGTGGTNGFFGDAASGVRIDTNSNAYIVGTTTSTNFPAIGNTISSCTTDANGIAFVTVINTATPAQTYSTCLGGGSSVEQGTGIALGPSNIVYVTGQTLSPNFPVTTNPIPPGGTVTHGVAFISRISTTGTPANQYSTFLGGTGGDIGLGIATDSAGNAYVTGGTGSSDFPIVQGALQSMEANPVGVGFISKINYPGGNGLGDLAYSSYFGGIGNGSGLPDFGDGIAVSTANNAYITGETSSPPTGAVPFPVTTGAIQTKLTSAASNAFVAELPLTPTITVSTTSINFGTQLVGLPTAPQLVTLTNNTSSAITLTPPSVSFTGANPGDFAVDPATTTCTASLPPSPATCTYGLVFTPSHPIAESATFNVFDSADSPRSIQVALSGTGSTTIGAIAFSPKSLTFTGQLLTTTSAGQTVTISNPSTTTALSISAIAVSNGDFKIASNSCGNTFPIMIAPSPGGTPCMLSITFGPAGSTAPGADAGTIMVTDNANASPQEVPLTGTAWDFSVTAGSASVATGAMGTFPVTITGLGGFTGAVSFMCTPGSSLVTACAVPTTNAAAAPGAMVNGTLTAASFIVTPESMKVPPTATPQQLLLVMLAIALLFMIPATRRFRTRLSMAGAMLVFIMVAGCTGNHPKPKTTALTVTPSSGGVTKPAITVNVTVTS